MWSVAMAIFSLSLTSLAYHSSTFDPNQIYIWLPITLVIDVGAVMQVFLLLIETPANPHEPDGKQIWNWNFIIRGFRRYKDGVDPTFRNQYPERNADQHHRSQDRKSIDWNSFRRSILLIVSILILIGLVVLQSLGLHYAIVGYHSSEPVFESWCSPAFQLGTKVYDLECHSYDIHFINGNGCINVSGNQKQWLLGTIWILSFEIFFEAFDLTWLILVNRSRKLWNEVDLKRPWTTIILGLLIWGALIWLGVIQTKTYPLIGASPYGMEVGLTGNLQQGNCTTTLFPSGLRGAIIAWSDGIFYSLGVTYFGPSGI